MKREHDDAYTHVRMKTSLRLLKRLRCQHCSLDLRAWIWFDTFRCPTQRRSCPIMHLQTSPSSGTPFSVDSSLSGHMFDAIPELCSDLSHGLSGIERSKVASVPLVVGATPKMQKHNLQELIEFNEKEFSPKVLINQPGYRLALLAYSGRCGPVIPGEA